jgi:hypothetical protein
MGPDMTREVRFIGWASLLCCSAILGCTKSAVQQKPVSDPLLVTKPPVEGRSHAAQASPLRRLEATPPPSPDEKN